MVRESAESERVEALQQELARRGQFYFKGFGMVLSDLLARIEIFVDDPTEEHAKNINIRLQKITGLYERIPFNQIADHPDFDLLAAVREAISQLHSEIGRIIKGETDLSRALETVETIYQAGQEYRARISGILHRLRAHPGQESAALQSVSVISGEEVNIRW